MWNLECRVYVASDDPKALGECHKKYHNIEFFGEQNVAKSADDIWYYGGQDEHQQEAHSI